ncbi:fibrillarin-like rRNA/tRNA 2'-O-methyltransferase [Candidatus Woesearchaeota archaeon]|nr:fibrillarin-like rRNA/tRNA 2'-O-methyltransferase [Candidatus Woesearchaeota archaeon]
MQTTKFPGIFETQVGRKRILLTKNLVKGKKVYDEYLHTEGPIEYREWNSSKSKLCAAILKNINQIGIKPGDIVLYLGASSGTTPSHVSDIVGSEGFVFGLDFAPRVVRDLVFLSKDRKNIAPILADANKPETYADRISAVDVVYMDIAQKNQTEIFLKNCNLFLKPDGYALLAIKARSIDVTKRPSIIFEEVRRLLEREMKLIDYKALDPFQLDHMMFICKKK